MCDTGLRRHPRQGVESDPARMRLSSHALDSHQVFTPHHIPRWHGCDARLLAANLRFDTEIRALLKWRTGMRIRRG